MMNGLSGRRSLNAVTARVLRCSLDPELRTDDAATELFHLAHGNRRVLERALGRIERGFTESSPEGDRALGILQEALHQLPTHGRTTCASR